MKRIIISRTVIFIIGLFLFIHKISAQYSVVKISTTPYSLIKDDAVRMAISVPTGVYIGKIGKNLEKKTGSLAFQEPEFLVLAFFKMIKTADMDGMVDLYDEASRGLIRERLNIAIANQEYQAYNDFELFSKNEFGSFTRIRFNFINTKTNDFFPWVLMIRKIGDRYYLTETIPLEHLFISASSAHPNNLNRIQIKSPPIDKLTSFSFAQDGNDIRQVENEMDKASAITVWLKLDFYDPDSIEQNPTAEISLLEQMKNTLVQKDSAAFIDLWAPDEQAAMTSDVFRSDVEVNRAFYKKISDLKPLGFLKAGDEIVLFFQSKMGDSYLPMQMMAMKRIGNKYKLRASLDTERLEGFYAWEILNNPSVKNAIEHYFTK